ncbi:MAG TPA: hypothetical protein VMD31_05105 [Opitutaceae bacterium]|nr:hypothetical protein [Opitutaceae bacterium]
MAITSKDLVAVLKKHPVAIGCGLLSVILLGASYWRSSEVSELADQLKQKEQEGGRILDDIRNGTNLAEQFDALAATTKELESRLVRSSERARNQQYFYRLESDTGVKELNLQPMGSGGAPVRGPKPIYLGVGYSISVQGDFRQIIDFTSRLESGQHFYRLVNASVTRDGVRGPTPGPGTITAALSLEFLGLP